MGADVVIIHPESAALRELAAELAGVGHRVQERAVAVGAAAYVLRSAPALAIVHASMPLVSGVQVIRSVVDADPGRTTRLLLYGEDDTMTLKREAADAGADDRVHGEGAGLIEAVQRWLPGSRRSAPSDSGTRMKGVGSYILIACAPSTSAHFTLLEPGAHRHYTDSGTEALRLICSPKPPRLALIGSSLNDLPCLTILQTAVRVDPAWRTRMVLLAEHGVAPVSAEVEHADAMVWSDREPPQGLAAIIERLRRAS